jgi:hypothetical protein
LQQRFHYRRPSGSLRQAISFTHFIEVWSENPMEMLGNIGRILQEAAKYRLDSLGARVTRSYAFTESIIKLNLQRLVGLSTPLHTWSGIYFGERDGDSLFNMSGIEVGRFYGNEVYGPDGTYLGELKDDRLLTHQTKKSRRQLSFIPERKKCRTEHRDQDGSVMLVGYEDFPNPDSFR